MEVSSCLALRWLLLDPSQVPARWHHRAVPMMLVPLLPHELSDAAELPEAESPGVADVALLGFLAQGLSKQRMARELHISMRTLDRRLQRLRRLLGVQSLAELAAVAARRGFGGPGGK